MTVKSKLLELLETHKGEVLSGEVIAGELNCTRAAVWKAVKSLREEGYIIEAGQNKGYRLPENTNRLSVEGVRLYLEHPDVKIEIYREVDSTNRAAKQAALSGQADHGSFVAAGCQTAGRGRKGRSFYSPVDAGIYLSVILKPRGTLQESLLLTTAAATAVLKAVREICGISLDIKWVNDLFYRGKKVCGILTEAVTDFESGDIQFAVVGIGLNLYQNTEELPEELRDVAGALYNSSTEAEAADRNRLTASIVNHLLEEMKEHRISREYIEHNIVPGHEIRILDGDRTRCAYAVSICDDGTLRVREKDGRETLLSYGEVSISFSEK